MSHTPGRSPRGKRGPEPDLKRRQRALALRAEGLSLAEVGRRLGVTRQMVHKDLKAAGQRGRVPARCADCRQAIGPGVYPPRRLAYCADCLARRPDVPFGTRLRSLRLAAGLTAHALGDRVGMFGPAVGAYESGRECPSGQPGGKCGDGRLLRLGWRRRRGGRRPAAGRPARPGRKHTGPGRHKGRPGPGC
jgi:DNA-binding CsgD family transcriptional regulator